MSVEESKSERLSRDKRSNNLLIFKFLQPSHASLPGVLRLSVGLPTEEKMAQILKSYHHPHQYLIGAFDKQKLVGVIGFNLIPSRVIIRHIGVLESYQRKTIGQRLIKFILQTFLPQKVGVETDKEALGFYQSLNFTCRAFQSQYGIRYSCSLDFSKR
jgi:GNAT superfamily N-acetyltransferase